LDARIGKASARRVRLAGIPARPYGERKTDPV